MFYTIFDGYDNTDILISISFWLDKSDNVKYFPPINGINKDENETGQYPKHFQDVKEKKYCDNLLNIIKKCNMFVPDFDKNLKLKTMRLKLTLWCFIVFTVISGIELKAQMTFNGSSLYGNEWITAGQSYYKFYVSKDGFYRLKYEEMAASGLPVDNIPANQFRIYHLGKEVAVLASTDAIMKPGDFFMIFGQENQGELDHTLFKDQTDLFNPYYSMFTSKSCYTITWSASPGAARISAINNELSAPVPKEEYFTNTERKVFSDTISKRAIGTGSFIRSPMYDAGQGFATEKNTFLTVPINFTGAFIGPNVPKAQIRFWMAGKGEDDAAHSCDISLDGVVVENEKFSGNKVHESRLALDHETLKQNYNLGITVDRTRNEFDLVSLSFIEWTFQKTYKFQNARFARMLIESSPIRKYLELEDFDGGAEIGVYDVTNSIFLTSTRENSGIYKITLPPSVKEREILVFNLSDRKDVSQLSEMKLIGIEKSNINYVILSHSKLMDDGTGKNPIEEYAEFRRSPEGGSYQVKVVDVDMVYDQFGYGIPGHPIAIRNFFQYLRNYYSDLKFALFIGKGLENKYSRKYSSEYDQFIFIPPFGYPGSDMPFVADNNFIPFCAYGRLPVINATEVRKYLEKVKEHEILLQKYSYTPENREWMKRIIHLSGGRPEDAASLQAELETMERVIENNQFGADVTTFYKLSSKPVTTPDLETIRSLVNGGVSMISYLGHSAATKLDFNVESVYAYSNREKYHVFLAMGCYAGEYYEPTRSLSEDYNLAPERGSVIYLSNSIAGQPTILGIWGSEFYKLIGGSFYGKSIGEAIQQVGITLMPNSVEAMASQIVSETFNGDPAIKFLGNNRPDLLFDPQSPKIEPGQLYASTKSFKFSVDVKNVGVHYKDSVLLTIEHQLPSGVKKIVVNEKIPTPAYKSTHTYSIQLDGDRSTGNNILFATLDRDSKITEGPAPDAERNNDLVLSNGDLGFPFYVVANDAQPVFPPEFAIINQDKPTLIACNGNTLASKTQYNFELDTTEYFNSPLLKSYKTTQTGGVVSWSTNQSLLPGKVYYWRVSPELGGSGNRAWINSSFIYLPSQSEGWNQSHFFQFTKDNLEDMVIAEPGRKFNFANEVIEFRASNGYIELPSYIRPRIYSGTGSVMDFQYWNHYNFNFSGIVVSMFDTDVNQMRVNVTGTDGGSFDDAHLLAGMPFYLFKTDTKAEREKLINFLKSIKVNDVVVIHTLRQKDLLFYPEEWESDGPENIYSLLNSYGATVVNELKTKGSVPYILTYRVQRPDYQVKEVIGDLTSEIELVNYFELPRREGNTQSTIIGPAASWENFEWNSNELEVPNDNESISIYGVNQNGSEVKLYDAFTQQNQDLRSINAKEYPNLKLKWSASDSLKRTASQLDFWRVHYTGLPDIAFHPALLFTKNKDTLNQGFPLKVEILAQNISTKDMDSLLVKFTVIDSRNKPVSSYTRMMPVKAMASLIVSQTVKTNSLRGACKLFIELNPNDDQPESVKFNNVAIVDFFVRRDVRRPLLDVTFDGKRISDYDLVSNRSKIQINLVDENETLLLDDTSLFEIKLEYPNREIKKIYFDQSNVTFTKASENTSTSQNEAIVQIQGDFSQEGVYTLIITAKDLNNNYATETANLVSFTITNEKSISQIYNYPNPFTTRTKFVYTLTGNELPAYYKMQILTVSGKVVKEITKEELGELKIGTHITEYEYDGTDDFGNKLANGVYLYRFITKDAAGKDYSKYETEGDKFFQNNFGKMVIIR